MLYPSITERGENWQRSIGVLAADTCCLRLPPSPALPKHSVLKWVHLNRGDAGLEALLAKFCHLLAPGGLLVLEPQPWKSYKAAAAKMRKQVRVVRWVARHGAVLCCVVLDASMRTGSKDSLIALYYCLRMFVRSH